MVVSRETEGGEICMNGIGLVLDTYSNLIISCSAVLIILLLIITIANSVKLRKMIRKYEKLISNCNSGDLEEVVLNYYGKIDEIDKRYKDIQQSIQKIEGQLSLCTQKVGIVRYNAFDDVGSNLSFAIALLDENDNGVVLNGVYSRDSSVTYGKPVENGKSKYPLSAEEIQAIDLARRNYNTRTFLYQ